MLCEVLYKNTKQQMNNLTWVAGDSTDLIYALACAVKAKFILSTDLEQQRVYSIVANASFYCFWSSTVSADAQNGNKEVLV